MILSCDFRKIESFDFDSKIFKSKSNDFVGRFSKKRIIWFWFKNFQIRIKWFCHVILEKSNYLILIVKFSNQNQLILSEDFRKNE